MRKVFVLVFVLAMGLMLAGCPPRKVVQPLQPYTPEETKERVVKVKPEEKIPEERIAEQEIAKIETRELEMPKYVEERDVFKDIHFDYDRYDIKDVDKQVLKSIAEWILKNKSAKLLIEGHCDERGTNEYNLALGDRRAKAARDYLLSLGIPSTRMDIISYGEEKPLCTEKTEECWQKNRRAHFVVLKETGK